jgi:hypothetical protein
LALVRPSSVFPRTLAFAAILALIGLAVAFAAAAPVLASSPIVVNSTHDVGHDGSLPNDVCGAAEPGTPCTLRAAVFVADHNPGSTIQIPAGEYKLDNGQLAITHDTTITGAGATSTIVNAQKLSRAFAIAPGAKVGISGLTVTNGRASVGGGILNLGGALTLTDVTVDNNTAGVAGGGVFNIGTLTVHGGFVNDNLAELFGGGVFNFVRSTLTVDVSASGKGAEFSNNTAGELGGGVFDGGHATITRALFDLDQAGTARTRNQLGAGGGIAVAPLVQMPDEVRGGLQSTDELPVTEDTLAPDTDASSTWAHVTLTTFADNSASVIGGGVAVFGGTALELTRSTLWQNTVTPVGRSLPVVAGGGLANVLGRVLLVNDTFDANVANGTNLEDGGWGGGIFQVGFERQIRVDSRTVDNSVLTLPHVSDIGQNYEDDDVAQTTIDLNTIAENAAEAGTGGGIFRFSGTMAISNTILSKNTAANKGTENCAGVPAAADAMYNLESANTCNFGSAKHDQTGTDPMLAALANNGGPTETMALTAGSPAIDEANPACPNKTGNEATDERGVTRPQGTACDIGAFEFVPAQPTPTPTPTSVPSPPVTGDGSGLTGPPTGNGPLAAFLLALGAVVTVGAGLALRSGHA